MQLKLLVVSLDHVEVHAILVRRRLPWLRLMLVVLNRYILVHLVTVVAEALIDLGLRSLMALHYVVLVFLGKLLLQPHLVFHQLELLLLLHYHLGLVVSDVKETHIAWILTFLIALGDEVLLSDVVLGACALGRIASILRQLVGCSSCDTRSLTWYWKILRM